VVGASGSDGGDGGIGADPSDNSVPATGSVHLFSLNGSAGFVINAGVNDAWVSDEAPLQGWFITVFEQLGLVFLSWFTFDSESQAGAAPAVFGANDTRWVTASGSYSGDTASLVAELTSGGAFNQAVPLAVQDTAYGTISIVFSSCNAATLTYDFPAAGLSGQVSIHRVLPSNVPLCEMLSAS